MKFRVKEYGGLLAACDDALVGSQFRGKHAEFYSGRLVEEKELKSLLASKTNINLAGEETIRIAERQGFALKKREVGGVPFALVLRMKK